MLFRVHRMKGQAKENFRWAPHTGGTAIVKSKDYEPAGEIEAASAYAAWITMREREQALEPGDILEAVTEDGTPGALQIVKYIGFEPAQWWVPEPKVQAPNPVEATPQTSPIDAPAQ